MLWLVGLIGLIALVLALDAVRVRRRIEALERRLRVLEPGPNPYGNSTAQLRAAFPGAGSGQARNPTADGNP
jgi:hypothetical protein